MVAVFPQKHFTDVNEWHRMGEVGIFPQDARMELIEGEILHMAPIGFNHAGHVARLIHAFTSRVQGQAIVNTQNPVQLGDLSEPEPDFMLLRLDPNFYTTRHPNAADVLLLVEVSDSTLRFDRDQKRRLYATHLIPEYWIVNLLDNQLEIFRQAQDGDYLQQTTLHTGDHLSPLAFPDLQIAIADIL